MDIKIRIIKIQLELVRNMLHFLLNFNKPTDKIVIFCSQQLDEIIVEHHKCKETSYKGSLSFYNIMNTCFKFKTAQNIIVDKAVNWVLMFSGLIICIVHAFSYCIVLKPV